MRWSELATEPVYLLAPLFERGVTLRGPIAEHTWLELSVMNNIMRRSSILAEGERWKGMERSGQTIAGEDAIGYNKYLDECDKFAQDSKSAKQEWWFLYCRGRRRNPVLHGSTTESDISGENLHEGNI